MKTNLNDLSVGNISSFPLAIKLIVMVVIFFGIISIGYWLDIGSQDKKLNAQKQKEVMLLQQISDKQAQTLNIKQHQEQLEILNKALQTVLLRFPSKSELPSILEKISNAAMSNELRFNLFMPMTAKVKGNYSVLPVEISITGNYHQLVKFISDRKNLQL